MQSIGELLSNAFSNMGSTEHHQGNPGDYIGDDDLLHCGVCGKAKEHRLAFNGRLVGCICQCEQDALEQKEAERQRQRELDRVKELASYSLVDDRFHESTLRCVPRSSG